MSNVLTTEFIRKVLFKAAQGKVRNHALQESDLDKYCPGLVHTLAAIINCRYSGDVVEYKVSGTTRFEGVEKYTIPTNLGLSEILNCGRVFANKDAQNRRHSCATFTEVKYDANKVVSADTFVGYWNFIENTAPNCFKYGLVNKKDYLLNELAYANFSYVQEDAGTFKRVTNLYEWEGESLSLAAVQALGLTVKDTVIPSAFYHLPTWEVSEEQIQFALAEVKEKVGGKGGNELKTASEIEKELKETEVK
jgi:hypothetical protein